MASIASPLAGKTAGMKSGIKGLAKPAPKVAAKKPVPKTSMTVEGAVDLSDGKFPKVPSTPVLPAEDAFAKLRTQQT
jgi:hypothetical protein